MTFLPCSYVEMSKLSRSRLYPVAPQFDEIIMESSLQWFHDFWCVLIRSHIQFLVWGHWWGARTMNSLPGVSFIFSHKSDKLFRFLTYMSGQQRYQVCTIWKEIGREWPTYAWNSGCKRNSRFVMHPGWSDPSQPSIDGPSCIGALSLRMTSRTNHSASLSIQVIFKSLSIRLTCM